MTEQLTWKPIKVALGDLIPNPNNPKSSDEETVERLRDSIDTLGQFETLAVDSDGVSAVDGHQRLNAWIDALGADYVVDAMQASRPLTEEEKRKIILYSGKGTHGQWDFEMLGDLFSEDELTDWGGFDAEQFEFGGEESSGGNTDEDAVPYAPEDPVTVLGDIWLMGDHRLMCGSSTSIDETELLLKGGVVDLVFSDPPYGIDVVQGSQVGGGGSTKFGKVGSGQIVESSTYMKIQGDETTETAAEFYQTCVALEINNILLWGGNYFTDFLYPSRCWVVWDKEMTGNFSQAEMAWTSFTKGGVSVFKHLWNGLSREGNRSEELKKRVHPTQKPVGLFVKIFERFDGFKSIYDGFMGSGSTLIACEKLGRKCYGMELEPHYNDVIVQRWQDYTGKHATLESTGQTFAEVKAERS